MSQPIISIIIVNYNTAHMIGPCLKSIEADLNFPVETFVVDNASQDDSVSQIKDNFSWVHLIESAHNLGFGKANNLAIPKCQGKYIYFLNPDTQIKQGSFQIMTKFMDQNSSVGLAGTRIVYPNGKEQDSVKYLYPRHRYGKKKFDQLKGDIAWVIGASMIARKEIIQSIGGFDERYFLYSEDIDLCLSVRQKGWEIGYIPDAEIIHWERQSETQSPPADVWQRLLKADRQFFEKNYSNIAFQCIRWSNIFQALWRILTLTPYRFFSSNKQEVQNKLDRYQLTLKMYK
ncbi:Glycosyl transferase, family 2 [Candidatus Magnetomorum sp. HK-1]|nr:Glycosyl transferase, family 2 [Candidatus Magnetomorum sp. HK-1]